MSPTLNLSFRRLPLAQLEHGSHDGLKQKTRLAAQTVTVRRSAPYGQGRVSACAMIALLN